MGKNKSLKPWVLFVISGLLLSAGWWLNSFPVFILVGTAPLFAIVDHVKEDDAFWTNIEFILLALFVGYFAVFHFESRHIVNAMVHAIVFTLAFLGFNYGHQQLGERLGKFTILFFWLAIEYLLLKLPWRDQVIFFCRQFQTQAIMGELEFPCGLPGRVAVDSSLQLADVCSGFQVRHSHELVDCCFGVDNIAHCLFAIFYSIRWHQQSADDFVILFN